MVINFLLLSLHGVATITVFVSHNIATATEKPRLRATVVLVLGSCRISRETERLQCAEKR